MTAETDIAALDDGGENTAAEVRTALTSVLSRADFGMLGVKTTSANTPDSDWASGLGNYAAVGASAGTAALIQAGAADLYDLTSRSGWMLVQVSGANTVQFRCDYTLPDERSMVLALAPGFSVNTGDNASYALRLNDDDDSSADGNYAACMLEQDSTEWVVQANSSADTGGTEIVAVPMLNAPSVFLRIVRSSLTYHCFASLSGWTWQWLDSFTFGAALDNVWISVTGQGTATNAPVVAIPWIAEGSDDVDPW